MISKFNAKRILAAVVIVAVLAVILWALVAHIAATSDAGEKFGSAFLALLSLACAGGGLLVIYTTSDKKTN